MNQFTRCQFFRFFHDQLGLDAIKSNVATTVACRCRNVVTEAGARWLADAVGIIGLSTSLYFVGGDSDASTEEDCNAL